MKHVIRIAALVLTLSLPFAVPATADQFEDGLAAAQSGDFATALRLWKPLADQGYALAQYNLGVTYANGYGVTQDYAAAAAWYRKAADQGHASAQFNLGFMYRAGFGVTQDYAAAAEWYRKAADQGYAAAQSNLGLMYAQGFGVAQDYVQAHMWFSLAADGGSKEAIKNRDIAAEKMTLEQIMEAQKLASEWKPKTP